MARLLPIFGTDSDSRIGDVVFIHGLDGNAITTWHLKNQPETFWPKWLGQDLPNVGIWSLDYDAASIAWRGSAMPLSDRATNTLALLEAYGLGRRPLVFVVHSLGGLLAKQILRQAIDYAQPEWKEIASSVRGIIFLATPHSGSDIASWLQYLGLLLRTNATIEDLQAHDPHLRDLNLWFRNNIAKFDIKCQAYFEKLKTANFTVVNETSADPGLQGVIPVPVDANHINICKVESRSDLIYVRTKNFLSSRLQPEQSLAGAVKNPIEYLYVDRRRLASYCQQIGKSTENEHEAIQAVIAALKPLSSLDNIAREEGLSFVFQRRRARRAYFSRKSAGLQANEGGLGLWITESLYLIEDPSKEQFDGITGSFTGYSSLTMLLDELGDRAGLIKTGITLPLEPEEHTLDLAPDFYSKLRNQDTEGMASMLAETIKATHPHLTTVPRLDVFQLSDSDAHIGLDFNEDWFDVSIEHDTGKNQGHPESTRLRLWHLPDTPLSRRFSRDPVAFLRSYNAKIAPERDIDVLFQVRILLPEGAVIGYPLVIAAAPSGLL